MMIISSHLLPERGPGWQSLQLEFVRLEVKEGGEEDLDLHQQQLVLASRLPVSDHDDRAGGILTPGHWAIGGSGGLRDSDHTNVNDLPRSLDSDALQLAEAVLKLGGSVGVAQLHHALVKQQLLAGAVIIPVLLLLFPTNEI